MNISRSIFCECYLHFDMSCIYHSGEEKKIRTRLRSYTWYYDSCVCSLQILLYISINIWVKWFLFVTNSKLIADKNILTKFMWYVAHYKLTNIVDYKLQNEIIKKIQSKKSQCASNSNMKGKKISIRNTLGVREKSPKI